jgi:surfeit locus 1 family protein
LYPGNLQKSPVSERISPLTVTRAGVIGTVIVLVVAALCVRLGFWQLSRLEQRTSRNRLQAQRMSEPPIPLELIGPDTSGLFYRRVLVEGQFDHDRTIVLSGRALRGVPGVHVLTPVLLGSGGRAVLLNRGWMPAMDAATVNYNSLRSPMRTRATGLLLPFPGSRSPGRETDAAADSTFRRVWFSPDATHLRRQFPYPLYDFQVQALPEAGAPSQPIRIPPPELDRGPHLGYAIQWFSFATIALVGWVTLMIRKGEVRKDSALRR